MKSLTMDTVSGVRSIKVTVNFKLASNDPLDFVRAIEKIDADDIKQAMLAVVDSIAREEQTIR